MNVRLSAGEVRVRIDRAEAEALARGEPLAAEVAFPGGAAFRWRLEPAGATAAALEGGALRVSVAQGELRALLEGPVTRDFGVNADAGGLHVAVEIDLHRAKKLAPREG